MRKGQTEIMGLMVIFILFIFLGLIYLKFSGGTKEEPMATSRLNLEGANMISAMMSYTICDENSFRDVLKTCVEGNQQVCGASSCEVIKSTAEAIVKAVMGNQTYQFNLVASGQDLAKIPEKAPKCTRTTVNTFNNTLVRDVYVKILLCQKGTEKKE